MVRLCQFGTAGTNVDAADVVLLETDLKNRNGHRPHPSSMSIQSSEHSHKSRRRMMDITVSASPHVSSTFETKGLLSL